MIKKTITYTDYFGNERTEDFYFNLSKAELLDLQYSQNGGLDQWAQSVMDAHDHKKLWSLFTELISKSYGVRSADGRRFMKSEEISKEFTETEAYSVLMNEFFTDNDSIINFFNGLVNGAKAEGVQDKPSLTIL